MNSQTFKIELKADVYGLDKFLDKPGIEWDDPKLDIIWGIEPEIKDFGVNWINISVKHIRGFIHYEGQEEGEFEFNSDNKIDGREWEIECLIDVGANGEIFPKIIEIDFDIMKIVVE